MKKLAGLATGYPRVIIGAVILLTVIAGFYAVRVTMTTDIKDFFPENDPRVQTYDRVEETFGGAEYIMVALTADDIFQPSVLKKIDRLTGELEAMDGVASVQSVTGVDEIKGTEMGLEISSLVGEIPETEAEIAVLREEIINDEMYGGFIVSRDGKAALNVVEVEPDADSVELAAEVERVIAEYEGPEELYLTGTPVLNNVLADSMISDLQKLLPLVLGIIALILFLFFRNARGVLLPFSTVLISVIWTLGLMGYLGKALSPLNAVMPIILISLGNAYGIYLLNRHREELGLGKTPSRSVIVALTSVGVAILMAGGTTVAGFASNVFSDITLMVDFGIFTSFGVAVALLISLTFIPAVLVLLKPGNGSRKKQGKGLMNRVVNYLADLAVNRAGLIVILALLIVAGSLFGLPRLRTDSNFFNFFAEDSEPKIAYNLVRDKFTGSESVEILIEGDIQDPEVLKAMKNFQDDLKSTGIVGEPTSLANIIERTNKAMNEDQEEYIRIPDNRNLIAQYLLLIEMNDSSYLQRFATMDYSQARIQALVRDTSDEATEELLTAIEELGNKHFAGLAVETTDTGIIVLIDALADMIIEGQIKGLVFALIAVLIIVLILLRSWQGSLLSVSLIALVTLINFGVMGWTGIPLDIVTVLISSIGIGVGIDYSIHIYARYLEEKKKGVETELAMATSITTTGTSIISNAGAVISGFIILILSSFPPFRYFGILVSLIMFAAAAGALLWIPAAVIFTEKISPKRG